MRTSFVTALVTIGLANGCGPEFEQPTNCQLYLECLAEAAPAQLGDAVEHFGPDGTCWYEDEDIADLCKDACAAGRKQLAEAFPNVSACR